MSTRVDDAGNRTNFRYLLRLDPILKCQIEAARGGFFDDDWLRRRKRDLGNWRLRHGRGDEGEGVMTLEVWRRGVRARARDA